MADETVTLRRRIEGLIILAKTNFILFLIHSLIAIMFYVMSLKKPADDNNTIPSIAAVHLFSCTLLLVSTAILFTLKEDIRINNRGNIEIGLWIILSCIAFLSSNALQIKFGLEPLILPTLGVVPFYIFLSLVLAIDIALYLLVFITLLL